MRVAVKLFAGLREELEHREMVVDLPGGARVQDLLQRLAEQYPVVDTYQASLHFAVNRKHAGQQTELHNGDEVALLPPVGGG